MGLPHTSSRNGGWHGKFVGVPVDAKGIEGSKDVLVLTEKGVLARISGDGEIAWRRADEAERFIVWENTGLILSVGSQLKAWCLHDGALQWIVPLRVEMLETLDTSLFVIAQDKLFKIDEYGVQTWSESFSNGAEGLACSGFEVFVISSSQELVFNAADGTVLQTTKKVNQSRKKPCENSLQVDSERFLDVDAFGRVSLKDYNGNTAWTRHEGLSAVEDACLISNLPRAQTETVKKTSTWFDRTRRHTSRAYQNGLRGLFSSIERLLTGDNSDGTSLLIVATKYKSLYALELREEVIIAWEKHDIDIDTLESNGQQVTAFKGRKTVGTFNFSGHIVATKPLGPLDFRVELSGGSMSGSRTVEGTSTTTWIYKPALGYEIISWAKKDTQSPVSSVGVVSGDASVSYKYVNENAIAVALYNDATEELMLVLLDAVTGRTLHTASHSDLVKLSPQHNFFLVFGEHWICYSYYSVSETPGTRLSLWNFYDPTYTDNIIQGVISAYNDTTVPVVAKKTLLVAEEIQALGISRTRYSISSHNILIGTTSGKVVALSKDNLVDGRRVANDTLVAVDQDGLSVLSGTDTVLGIHAFSAQPHIYESTYSAIAYGDMDLYVTPYAPSGSFDSLPKQFAAWKLITTIATLSIFAILLKILAGKKRLRAHWQ